MSARSNRQLDKNRDKLVQDRIQLLLTRLLQDEDNKYCIDCDSKGPRWASWNIGIFLCIRCAGIHRNLGVHISKVKSVNLDTWTPQQVASMQMMGNSKGRAVYEAGLPEDYRRPHSDAALETFIRSKYEKKKYIAREWTPAKPPDLPLGWAELIEAEKQKKDIRSIVLPSRAVPMPPTNSNKTENEISCVTNASEGANVPVNQKEATDTKKAVEIEGAASEDLLGLITNGTTPAPLPPSASLSSQLDLLCIGSNQTDSGGGGSKDVDFSDFISAASESTVAPSPASTVQDFVNLDVGGEFPSPASSLAGGAAAGNNQMSKDSIMALFNQPQSQSPQPQPAAVGGMQQTFGAPQLGGGIQLHPQQTQGMNLMNPNAQPGQAGVPGRLNNPPAAAAASNPFLTNAQLDLGFGSMNATTNGSVPKSSSWGFAQ